MKQGKMTEAEKMNQRALEGKDKAWGPEHTSTLDTVNTLGILYADQGKLAEAEKIYERARRLTVRLSVPRVWRGESPCGRCEHYAAVGYGTLARTYICGC